MMEASAIAARQKSRTSGSSRTRSAVAPVSAETGFIVRLPQSLYQMSYWMRFDCVTSKPAFARSAAMLARRAVERPSGSPTMSPWPLRCSENPGSGSAALMCTTHPRRRCVAIARPTAPPGSTASMRMPSHGPPRPWKNHQGTPFIAARTTLSGPSSGAMRAATAGSAGPFTARITRSCGPSSAGSSEARTLGASTSPSRRKRSPCAPIASSAAPRATTLTSHSPRAARRAPMRPPMAPAP